MWHADDCDLHAEIRIAIRRREIARGVQYSSKTAPICTTSCKCVPFLPAREDFSHEYTSRLISSIKQKKTRRRVSRQIKRLIY